MVYRPSEGIRKRPVRISRAAIYELKYEMYVPLQTLDIAFEFFHVEPFPAHLIKGILAQGLNADADPICCLRQEIGHLRIYVFADFKMKGDCTVPTVLFLQPIKSAKNRFAMPVVDIDLRVGEVQVRELVSAENE